MNCKNCETKLEGEKKFCTNCGAKVINHRLNLKTVTEEFFATFISWDNKFFKTFVHMFYKPEFVVSSYLNGVRKRYMQPFSFMMIALFLYGLLMYFAKDAMQEYADAIILLSKDQNRDVKFNALMQVYQKKANTFATNYFNLITFALIPVFSLINLIIFYRKQNFIEHNISVLYTYANYQFVFVILATFALLFGIPFLYLMPFSLSYMLFYHAYFFKKIFNLTLWQIIYKTILFLLILFIISMGITIVAMIIFFILNRNAM